MIKLADFWEASMTILRRELTGEQIDSEFVMKNGDVGVKAFFPNISNAEINVILEGDDEYDEEEDYEY